MCCTHSPFWCLSWKIFSKLRQKLDCPVRNHWENDREACRLLRCNAKYTGRISPTLEKSTLLSSAGYECGGGTVNYLEGYQTCSAVQVPQPRVRSAPQSLSSQRQTSQSHAGLSYTFKSNISFRQVTYERISWRWILLALSANFKQCTQKCHSVGSILDVIRTRIK